MFCAEGERVVNMSERPSRGPASDEAATAAALRRYLRWTVICLVPGLGIFAPVLVASLRVDAASERLWVEGERVDGVVTRPFTTAPLGPRNPEIEVQFTYRGSDRRETIRLNDNLTPFKLGQRVDVFVDPDDPQRVTLFEQYNTSRTSDLLFGFALAAGGAPLIIGVVGASRWLRWKSYLAKGPWSPAQVVCHGEVGPLSRMVVCIIGPGDEEVTAYCVGITTTRKLECLCGGEVWSRAAGRRRLALGVEGGSILLDCFQPRTRWGRRRLTRRIE